MSRVSRVLIVEDDQSMKIILSDFLKKQGYSVTTATSASLALSLLATLSRGKYPDLVLSDVKLGTMSGIEMTAQIKKEHPDLPVILFSVFDQLEKEALASGARRFMKKPFSLKKLEEVLQEELNGKAIT